MKSTGYECPNCKRVSFNPRDLLARYCGACRLFEGYDRLIIWTLYEHPTDYPNEYVLRRFDVEPDMAIGTKHCLTADTADELRDAAMRAGLTRIKRNPEDESQVMESWL